jgi:hypothetical protein
MYLRSSLDREGQFVAAAYAPVRSIRVGRSIDPNLRTATKAFSALRLASFLGSAYQSSKPAGLAGGAVLFLTRSGFAAALGRIGVSVPSL